MTALYSVTINRKVFVTRYLDPKGKHFEQSEQLLSQTYHDLPLATAQGYKKLDADAVITIQQPEETRFSSKGKFQVSGMSTAPRYSTKKTSFKEAAPDAPVVTPAKQTGTYGDLVNSMMKG